MVENKLLVRAARQMGQAWNQAAEGASRQLDNALDHVEQRHLAFQQTRRRLDNVPSCRQAAALLTLQREILARLGHLREAINKVEGQFAESTRNVPKVQTLREELCQIDADIGGLEIDLDQKSVSAVTDPITLKDIDLGPFAIRFFWDRLASSMDFLCFDIVALDSNPAGSDDSVTHPHVKNEKLCAGEAAVPLKSALQQGRLADAFNLIRSVLTTYNPQSPHVALEDWEGNSCNECGYSAGSDDLRFCEGCSEDYCSECISSCACCEDSRCTGCLENCAVCQESCCRGCLHNIGEPGRSCCSQCRLACPRCLEQFATDDKAEGSDLCPACRESDPASDPSALVVPASEPSPPSLSQEPLDESEDEEFCVVSVPA